MNSFARVASLLLVFVVAAIAESPVDGEWAGAIPNGETTQPIMLSLHTDDTKLTGSVIGAGGVETSIQDGTFEGTVLQFKTVQRDGDSSTTYKCIGSIVEDSISFSCTTGEQTDPREFTVKRQKNQ